MKVSHINTNFKGIKIAKASIDAVLGGEIKAAVSKKLTTDDEKHSCSNCLSGEIYAKFELKYNIKLLNQDKWDFKYTIANVKLKVTDFYFSGDFFEFDFTKCPHKEYKLTVNVKDNNNKSLNGVEVKIGGKSVTTNTFGNAIVYLSDGNYTLNVSNSTSVPCSLAVTVNGKPQKIETILLFNDIALSANKLSFGDHSAVITEDGSLYTWGRNGYGQLGNGTTTNSSIPIKIMDNVDSVSLEHSHGAAITKDGSLYTWGDNEYGQLGNGTTTDSLVPIKIMDNVLGVLVRTALRWNNNQWLRTNKNNG